MKNGCLYSIFIFFDEYHVCNLYNYDGENSVKYYNFVIMILDK